MCPTSFVLLRLSKRLHPFGSFAHTKNVWDSVDNVSLTPWFISRSWAAAAAGRWANSVSHGLSERWCLCDKDSHRSWVNGLGCCRDSFIVVHKKSLSLWIFFSIWCCDVFLWWLSKNTAIISLRSFRTFLDLTSECSKSTSHDMHYDRADYQWGGSFR